MLQYMICKRFVRSLYSFHCFYYILQNQQLQNFYSSYAIGISMSSKFITRIYIPTWNPFLALLSSQWSKQFCCSCVFEITCKKNILSLNICSWQTNNKSEELETNHYLKRSNAENLIWNLVLGGIYYGIIYYYYSLFKSHILETFDEYYQRKGYSSEMYLNLHHNVPDIQKSIFCTKRLVQRN